MIRDRNIEWARQRMYIPLETFQGWSDAHVGLGAGAPAQGELSTFGYYGMIIAAANDAITHVIEFPSCWDITKEIGVRVRWMVEGTVALDDAVVFQILYDQIDNGEVSIEPATALGTVITTQSPAVTTTLAMYRSPRGIIAANTFDENAIDGMLVFKIVTPTLTQFEVTEVHILGVSFDYYPRMTVGGYVALETDRQ
jgi:hypothetical protein